MYHDLTDRPVGLLNNRLRWLIRVCGSKSGNQGASAIRTSCLRLALVFLRRLSLPVVLFAGFNLLCVVAYRRLEGLRWQDAFFWITHPHSIDYRPLHDSTKFFAIVVYFCVFPFQIWIAERVLVTIFRRPGMELGNP